jgi:glycosyltransferase involved in cell wall biosynthesis
MSQQQFTIALPVRNGGDYVRAAVQSVLAQTAADFDLVVLDNSSEDGTADWCESLRDSRVTVLRSHRVLSIEESWQRIAAIRKNEFLSILCHDDVLDPHFLRVVQQLIRAQPHAAIYSTHFRLITAAGATLRPCQPMPFRETAAEYLATRLAGIRDSYVTGHVFRSADYEREGGIPLYHKLLYADDALFMQLVGEGFRVTAFDECCSYRCHEASVSTAAGSVDYLEAMERYSTFLQNLRATSPMVERVLQRYSRQFFVREAGRWYTTILEEALLCGQPESPTFRDRVGELFTKLAPADSALGLEFGHHVSCLERALGSVWRRQRYRSRQAFRNAVRNVRTSILSIFGQS